MTISQSWSITGVKALSSNGQLTKIVETVDWQVTVTDGTSSAQTFGRASLGNPSPASFIAYEDLSQEDIILWVKSSLSSTPSSSDGKNELDAIILSLSGQVKTASEAKYSYLDLP